MGLKAVFFDMDDTLVLTTEADKQACGQVGELAKLLHPEVDQAVLIEDWHRRFVEAPWDPDMKVPVPEWRAAHWKDALQDQAVEAPETAAELQRLFDAARIELFRFEPAVKELAANLKSSGVRCIIITNGHADIQRTKLEACRAAHLFDAILAVHIGDNLVTDVAGANRAGLMASVWVNRGAKPLPGGLELDCRPTHTVKHTTQTFMNGQRIEFHASEEAYFAYVNARGLDKKDLKIELSEGRLIVLKRGISSGAPGPSSAPPAETWASIGSFELPEDAITDSMYARLTDGELFISVQRTPQVKPEVVEVAIEVDLLAETAAESDKTKTGSTHSASSKDEEAK